MSFWNYRNIALVTATLVELNCSVHQCIKRIVLTHSNVLACIVLRATLTNNDVACYYLLTAKNFHAQSLSSTLTAVLRTTYTFLMCHNVVPPKF